MGWMQPAHFSFLCGLDATSPFFFSPWAGCNQLIFLFSVGWMQPAHFSLLHGLDETSPFFCANIFDSWHTTLHHDCSIIDDLFETQDNLHVLFRQLINNIMIAILACIWNPVPLDRIGQNGTYWYVPVRTSTKQHRPVQEFPVCTYWYVPVHTGAYF